MNNWIYKNAEIEKISNYLSLLQLRYDSETICGLVAKLKINGMVSFGVIPYISLTVAAILEFIGRYENNALSLSKEFGINDIRLKLKIFEKGYSSSKRMILNIDYLSDQIFKKELRFEFMKNWKIHNNFGVYTDVNKRIIGNTQYNYYIIQDNKFLKKKIDLVAKSYSESSKKYGLDEEVGKKLSKYSYNCMQIIKSFNASFGNSIPIVSKEWIMDYYFADYNTNKKSSLFLSGDDEKAIRLYLIHILSNMNFLLCVLNNYQEDDCGWWLKINYISYYYTIQKLQNLKRYLAQNKVIISKPLSFFETIELDNPKYINSDFRNYIMHSQLIDKNGILLMNRKIIDKSKPLFGLVETQFDGMSYNELKESIIIEMNKISQMLSQWLETEKLHTKILKD